ncbi:hypothetical protein [Desulfurobacterium atlanticum]|uniref:Uncharacterized protein n=1 Tax=Desulfurobacterium atlanticum TaxID=240169 RepID=A0A239A7S8_9BACT|nr:hypothetical protein [Desulfurobacterium atlanticum]SNR91620.1 hypothetical protein SAMN06265340_11619 [Desulfurobacterium atlanticum]
MRKLIVTIATLFPITAMAGGVISPLLKGTPSPDVDEWKKKIEEQLKEKPKFPEEKEYPQPFHAPNGYEYPVKDVCVACHSYAAHTKDETLAPFYNAHSTFMSCTTCHYKASDISYAWVEIDDEGNAKIVKDTQDMYGVRYVKAGGRVALSGIDSDARITPVVNGKPVEIPLKGNEGILHDPGAVSIIYSNLAKDPFKCADCHSANPPLNLVGLGFSQERIQDIENNEVVKGLLQEGKIYFPNFIWKR